MRPKGRKFSCIKFQIIQKLEYASLQADLPSLVEKFAICYARMMQFVQEVEPYLLVQSSLIVIFMYLEKDK